MAHLKLGSVTVPSGTLAIDDVVKIIVNAKTSYPGGAVCNAVEHILVRAGH